MLNRVYASAGNSATTRGNHKGRPYNAVGTLVVALISPPPHPRQAYPATSNLNYMARTIDEKQQ